jgi:hypothetical protein
MLKPLSADLRAELKARAALGLHPVSVREFERRLLAVGYKLDRALDCACVSRIMTGDRAGQTYPTITTSATHIESGLGFAHCDAPRDHRYEAFKAVRNSTFSVTRGAILEI